MPRVNYGDYILPSCAGQLARFLGEKNPAFRPGDNLLCNAVWDPTVSSRRRTVVIFDAHDETRKLGPLKTLAKGPSCERNIVAVTSYGGSPTENAARLAEAVNALCSWRDEVLEGDGPRVLLLSVKTLGQPVRLGKGVSGDEARTQKLTVLRRLLTPADPEWVGRRPGGPGGVFDPALIARIASLEDGFEVFAGKLAALVAAADAVLAMPRTTDNERNACWAALLALIAEAVRE